MSPNNDNQEPQRSIEERIDALTGNNVHLNGRLNAMASEYAFSIKLHADMIVSLDTQMQQLTANVDKLTTDVRNLTIDVQNLTIDVRNLTEISKRNTEHAARLDIKFDRLAEIMTGLFQKHDERITAIERKL